PDIRARNPVFSGVAAHTVAMVGVSEKGNTRRVFADIVSADYFAVLGVAPLQGRVFLPEEETPGRDAPVALVSYSYWTRHNRAPSTLGVSNSNQRSLLHCDRNFAADFYRHDDGVFPGSLGAAQRLRIDRE